MRNVSCWVRILSLITMRFRFLGICLYFILWILGSLHAKTEVFFSPGGLIKDKIIRNIDSSEKSIDIAALQFSSGEIAEALYKAKERGIEIRIILDYRQKQKRHPLVEFLKSEGFRLEFLKANIGGFMNNTFVIFDSKILVTGSYNWSEYSEKFNYENVLFVDESDVIKRFQEEFESLYEKSMVKKGIVDEELESFESVSPDETVSETNSEKMLSDMNRLTENTKSREFGIDLKITGSQDSDRIPILEKSSHNAFDKSKKEDREKVLHKGFESSLKREDSYNAAEQSKPYPQTFADELIVNHGNELLSISFQEFDSLFGKDGKLNRAEKKKVWKDQFEGKYVKWTGTIGYKGIAVYDWNKIGIMHKSRDIDVQLRFNWTKKRVLMNLVMGDVITYTGKLVSPGGFMAPCRLDNADVLDIQ